MRVGKALMEAGVDKELLVLGAAENGNKEAGEWLKNEGAQGTQPVGPDQQRRVARDVGMSVSSGSAWRFFARLGAFLSRYRVRDGPPQHISATCGVVFAIDLKSEQREEVCLKKMRHRSQFESEIRQRFVEDPNSGDVVAVSIDDVIGVLCCHTPEAAPFKDALVKPQEKEHTDGTSNGVYPYVLVLVKGVRSLHQACDSERIAGYDLAGIRKAMIDTLTKVQRLHEQGIVHGDLKPRNILRSAKDDWIDDDWIVVDPLRGGSSWILCDMDAAAQVGAEIGSKSSSAYSPPELAKLKFTDAGVDVLASARPSFDVWSAGVILYELTAGHGLFAQDTANDELIERKDRTRLCTWHTVSEATMDDCLRHLLDEGEVDLVDDVKDLMRWCLKGKAEDRPRIAQMLAHPFLAGAGSRRDCGMLYSTFLSHAQADAAGVVGTLYFKLGELGVTSWLDMYQTVLTLDSMKQGVSDSDVFTLELTEHVLDSWFCRQEISWAIEAKKPIQLLLDEDYRLGQPFGLHTWRASGSYKKLDDAEREKLEKMLSDNLPKAIIYRRRDFEADAMMREVCERRPGELQLLLPPPAPVVLSSEPSGTALRRTGTARASINVLIVGADGGDGMGVDVKDGRVDWNVRGLESSQHLSFDVAAVGEATKVLLLLSPGVLAPGSDSLLRIVEVRAADKANKTDRFVIVYDPAVWDFAGAEKQGADADVQDVIDNHECVTWRPPTTAGSRHEFPAMVNELLIRLGAPPLDAPADEARAARGEVAFEVLDEELAKQSEIREAEKQIRQLEWHMKVKREQLSKLRPLSLQEQLLAIQQPNV